MGRVKLDREETAVGNESSSDGVHIGCYTPFLLLSHLFSLLGLALAKLQVQNQETHCMSNGLQMSKGGWRDKRKQQVTLIYGPCFQKHRIVPILCRMITTCMQADYLTGITWMSPVKGGG